MEERPENSDHTNKEFIEHSIQKVEMNNQDAVMTTPTTAVHVSPDQQEVEQSCELSANSVENKVDFSSQSTCLIRHDEHPESQTSESGEYVESKIEKMFDDAKIQTSESDDYIKNKVEENCDNVKSQAIEHCYGGRHNDESHENTKGQTYRVNSYKKDDGKGNYVPKTEEYQYAECQNEQNEEIGNIERPSFLDRKNECFETVQTGNQYLDNYDDLGIQKTDLRMVVIGKAGNGKSETANTIIGDNKFVTDMCASSVTHVCQREDTERLDRRISVVDTPGLFDISSSNDEIAKEIANFISFTIPGPHAILFIAKIGRFTQEDQHTFDKVVEYFGESILDYCIVVFTHHDLWKRKNKNKTIENFVKSSKEWSKITDRCSNRYIAFENNPDDPTNDEQVDKLIAIVSDMAQNCSNGFYSNKLYVEATNIRLAEIDRENKIREEELRLKELERKLIEEEKRLISEENKRQELERKRQEKEKERLDEERKRQSDESARLQELRRRHAKQERKLEKALDRIERLEDREERRKEKREEEKWKQEREIKELRAQVRRQEEKGETHLKRGSEKKEEARKQKNWEDESSRCSVS